MSGLSVLIKSTLKIPELISEAMVSTLCISLAQHIYQPQWDVFSYTGKDGMMLMCILVVAHLLQPL